MCKVISLLFWIKLYRIPLNIFFKNLWVLQNKKVYSIMGLCHFDNFENARSTKDDVQSQFSVFFSLLFKSFLVMGKTPLTKQFWESNYGRLLSQYLCWGTEGILAYVYEIIQCARHWKGDTWMNSFTIPKMEKNN